MASYCLPAGKRLLIAVVFTSVGAPLGASAGGWRLIDAPVAPSSSVIESWSAPSGRLQWNTVSESQIVNAAQQSQSHAEPQSTDADTVSSVSSEAVRPLPVFSVGVGVRTLSQDKTNLTMQGAVRALQTGNRVLSSFSVRPAVIFPDSGCSSCGYETRLSGTIDFFQSELLSFYLGGGAAFNKDSANNVKGRGTFAMFTGGVELNLSRNLAITGNLNLINQPSDPQFGGLTWADAETSILFTARF